MGASSMSHHLCLYKICVTCSLVSEEEADQIFFFISSSLITINIYAICCNFGLCVVLDKLGGLFSFFGTWMDKWYVSGILAPFCCLEKHWRDDFIFFENVFKICLCLIIRNETLKNGTDYILKFFCISNSSFGVNYPQHQNLLLQSIFLLLFERVFTVTWLVQI